MPPPIWQRPGVPSSLGDHERRIRALERQTGRGIQFDVDNVGNWLYIDAQNSVSLRSNGGITFDRSGTGAYPDFECFLSNFLIDVRSGGNATVQCEGTLNLASTSADVTVNAATPITISTGDDLNLTGGKIGFFGAPAVSQPAHPVTLTDVINALAALGLTA